jgi:hypothetical protein
MEHHPPRLFVSYAGNTTPNEPLFQRMIEDLRALHVELILDDSHNSPETEMIHELQHCDRFILVPSREALISSHVSMITSVAMALIGKNYLQGVRFLVTPLAPKNSPLSGQACLKFPPCGIIFWPAHNWCSSSHKRLQCKTSPSLLDHRHLPPRLLHQGMFLLFHLLPHLPLRPGSMSKPRSLIKRHRGLPHHLSPSSHRGGSQLPPSPGKPFSLSA